MSGCGFPRELLSAYLDGEAGGRAREVERHLESCAPCRGEIAEWRRSGLELTRTVDRGVGEVEPLQALARIRARIAAAEARSPVQRLSVWWRELWAYRRGAATGIAVAAALGALAAPFFVYWTAQQGVPSAARGNEFAGVVIESMEWGGGKQAVIYQSGGGATTLIWVEPDATDRATAPSPAP